MSASFTNETVTTDLGIDPLVALALSSFGVMTLTLLLASCIVLPSALCEIARCCFRPLRRYLGDAGRVLLEEVAGRDEDVTIHEEIELDDIPAPGQRLCRRDEEEGQKPTNGRFNIMEDWEDNEEERLNILKAFNSPYLRL